MTKLLTAEEYIKQGKETTAQALKEIKKQLVAKEKTIKEALKPVNEYENIDSDSDDASQMNFTLLEHEVSNEINSFKSNIPSQYTHVQDSKSNDRILQIFNNLMIRNNKLVNFNNKLTSNIKILKREITVLERNSHTDKVFNNSNTIEKNDLLDKNKALFLSIKEKNQEIKNYNRTYYICRFIIGFLVILSIYLFIQSILA